MVPAESKIRQSIVRMLIEDYGYSAEQIDFEVKINKLRRADCIVYTDEKKDKPFILIEIKRPALYSLHTEQLATYMRLIRTQYGMLTDGLSTYCYQLIGNEITEVSAIPRKGEEMKKLSKPELKPIASFAYRLQNIYDRIRSSKKLPPSQVLNEIRKLLLCKLEDEKSRSTILTFRIDPNEIREIESRHVQMAIAGRMRSLFDRVKMRYPQLYSNSEILDLDPRTLAYILAQLQNYSLSQTSHEDVSAAYTQFVSKNMYMRLGQYFTAKQLTDFIVRLADPIEHERVLDPACGSGRFLLSAMYHVSKRTQAQFDTEAEYARERIFGIDINPDMVSICKTNMLFHGDGHANIFLADFLADLSKTDAISLEPFDVILTDPPYGYSIRDRNILRRFKLGENQKSQQIQVLFIEKCIEMLRPSGRLSVVVPELFLTSPSLRSARRFVLDNAEIRAIISMPGRAFAPYSSLRISILVLQKKGEAKIPKDYDVLMIEASDVTTEILDGIVRCYRNPLERAQLPGVKVFRIKSSELGMRWDIAFHRSFEFALPKNSLRLEQIAQLQKGISIPSREYLGPIAQKGVYYIRISDISEGQIRIETAKRVPTKYNKNRVRTGDILLSIRGSIGKTAIVTESSEGATPSSQLVVIRPKENLVNRKYLFVILSSHLVQRQLDYLKVGTLISSVPFLELRQVLIPVPSLKDQERLVHRIDELETAYTKTSEKQENLKKELERFLKVGFYE